MLGFNQEFDMRLCAWSCFISRPVTISEPGWGDLKRYSVDISENARPLVNGRQLATWETCNSQSDINSTFKNVPDLLVSDKFTMIILHVLIVNSLSNTSFNWGFFRKDLGENSAVLPTFGFWNRPRLSGSSFTFHHQSPTRRLDQFWTAPWIHKLN